MHTFSKHGNLCTQIFPPAAPQNLKTFHRGVLHVVKCSSRKMWKVGGGGRISKRPASNTILETHESIFASNKYKCFKSLSSYVV